MKRAYPTFTKAFTKASNFYIKFDKKNAENDTFFL